MRSPKPSDMRQKLFVVGSLGIAMIVGAAQFTVENLSNEVHLLSKERTMVQGQYSSPRVFSGSVKVRF